MAVIEENNKNVIFSSCYFSQGVCVNILIYLILSNFTYLNTKERVSHWSDLYNISDYVEMDQNHITHSSQSGEKKNDKIKPW